MKILAILGSPHAGKSLALTRRVESLLISHGNVEFKTVHLKDIKLLPCKGCFTCFLEGEEACKLKDDGKVLRAMMDEADGVIFVSPVYSMHVSYLFKQFIDRFASTFHRPRYFGKYAMGIVTTGGVGLEETLAYIKMVAVAWGFDYVESLGLIDPPEPIPVMVPQIDRTEEAALRFYEAVKNRRPRKLAFSDHLHFRAMQAVYSYMEKYSPADFSYWKEKGWLDPHARYFMESKGNPVKDRMAMGMARLIRRKIAKTLRNQKPEESTESNDRDI